MVFPATPGWGAVLVVVGPSPLLAEDPGWAFPGNSWLRAPAAGPRHSWLGSAGRGGGGGLFPWGLMGGFSCCVCLWLGVCAMCLCLCVCCVFVVSVLVVVRVCLPRVLVCVCVCVWRVGGLWLLVLASLRWGLLLVLVLVSLVCAVVGLSPLLAESLECHSPPLLAGFRFRLLPVFLATPGCGPRARGPAAPSWTPLVVVGCGPLPLLVAGPGCGSPPLLAGVHQLRLGDLSGWGLSCVVCVCGVGVWAWCSCCCVFCVFVVSELLVVWRGCVFRVRWCACLRVRGVSLFLVARPCLSLYGLAAGVCVGVIGVCCGSPTTPS